MFGAVSFFVFRLGLRACNSNTCIANNASCCYPFYRSVRSMSVGFVDTCKAKQSDKLRIASRRVTPKQRNTLNLPRWTDHGELLLACTPGYLGAVRISFLLPPMEEAGTTPTAIPRRGPSPEFVFYFFFLFVFLLLLLPSSSRNPIATHSWLAIASWWLQLFFSS